MVRVLGVDPGSRRLGWAIVERRGSSTQARAAGVVRLSADEPLEVRLDGVHRALVEVVERYAPTDLAVEDVFHGRFPASGIRLAHVRGVVLLVGAQRGLSVTSYPPALVKRALAGRGAADKTQVARLVAATLRLPTVPPADAADALAIALAHCSNAKVFRRTVSLG